MIRVDIRRKDFGTRQVLGTVRLDLDDGARAAILGPSGIGKSTLLRIIAGLDVAYDGTVERPERIAMVFQEPTLLDWRSVLDNIRLVTGVSDANARAALDQVGLSDHAGHFPNQLSLGQRRRAGLARALAARPQLLLLDEPFASLDAGLADEMRRLVSRLISDSAATVILVTHVADDAVALNAKSYVLNGAPAVLTEGQ